MNSAKKKQLRALAHGLKPVVIIGQAGLTDNVINEIIIALEAHELIKVKVRFEKAERQSILEQILLTTPAQHIQSIGQIFVLFAPAPQKNKKPASG